MNADKLTLDVDGVLANFIGKFAETARSMGHTGVPPHWTHHDDFHAIEDDIFGEVWSEIEDDYSWWLSIEPYDDAYVGVPVNAYVTARPIPSQITRLWLNMHGFPDARVYTVGPKNSKAEALRRVGADTFVDDKTKNVLEVNGMEGTDGVLLRRPWNKGKRVGLTSAETIAQLT